MNFSAIGQGQLAGDQPSRRISFVIRGRRRARMMFFLRCYLVAVLVTLSIATETRCQIVDEELPFAVAAEGDEILMEELLSKGVSPNLSDRFGWTLLAHAAANNNAGVAEFLIRSGANVSVRDLDKSPLVIAAATGSNLVADLLVRTDRIPASHMNEAYSVAAMQGNETLIRTMNIALGVSSAAFEAKYNLNVYKDMLKRRFGSEPTDMDSAFVLQMLNACRAQNLHAQKVCVSSGWVRQ